MTNKATKYGLMIIAAVMLVAVAFAGTASAEAHDITSQADWESYFVENGTDLYLMTGEYNFKNGVILPMGNISYAVQINDDVTLDFSNFQGSFPNYEGVDGYIGALFGNVTFLSPQSKLTIKNAKITGLSLNATSNTANASRVGGLIGHVTSKFTEESSLPTISLENCEIHDSSIASGSAYIGGLLGRSVGCKCEITNCIVDNTIVHGISDKSNTAAGIVGRIDGGLIIATNSKIIDSKIVLDNNKNQNLGGIIGTFTTAYNSEFTGCTIENSSLYARVSAVGGLIGYYDKGNLSITDCNVKDSSIKVSDAGVAGLIGRIMCGSPYSISITNSHVTNSYIEGTSSSLTYGGLGGLIGQAPALKSLKISYSSVKDTVISSTSNSQMSPIVAYFGMKGSEDRPVEYSVDNTNVINVTLNGSVSQSLANSYGFDAIKGDYVFTAQAGGLNISEIQLTNGNSIKNLIIKNEIYPVPNNKNMTFNGVANITGATLGDSWTYIVADAFTDTGIETYVVLPNAASAGYVSWVLDNSTRDAISVLDKSKFMYAAIRSGANQEVTLNANGGTVNGKLFVTKNEVPAIAPLAEKAGYNFSGWYGETALTNMVFNDTGVVNKSVSGWTDENGKWIHEGASTLYANWTAVEYNTSVVNNNVTFPSNLLVVSINFNPNSDVTKVAFKYEAPQGNPQKGGFTVDTIGDPFTLTPTGSLNGTKAVVNFNLTSAQMESYNPENIRLAHYVGSAWTFVKPTYNGLIADNHTFSAEIDSMSPFAVVSYVENPSTYTPSSSSKHSGSTVILSEGQTAPTAYATATPTVSPTVKPTEQPATPTVIATVAPTTQATQQSPAPFLGILAGLGAAAVLLRMRK